MKKPQDLNQRGTLSGNAQENARGSRGPPYSDQEANPNAKRRGDRRLNEELGAKGPAPPLGQRHRGAGSSVDAASSRKGGADETPELKAGDGVPSEVRCVSRSVALVPNYPRCPG